MRNNPISWIGSIRWRNTIATMVGCETPAWAPYILGAGPCGNVGCYLTHTFRSKAFEPRNISCLGGLWKVNPHSHMSSSCLNKSELDNIPVLVGTATNQCPQYTHDRLLPHMQDKSRHIHPKARCWMPLESINDCMAIVVTPKTLPPCTNTSCISGVWTTDLTSQVSKPTPYNPKHEISATHTPNNPLRMNFHNDATIQRATLESTGSQTTSTPL